MKEVIRLEAIKARYPFSKKDVLQGIDIKIFKGAQWSRKIYFIQSNLWNPSTI